MTKDDETELKRDAALKRALTKPHKPQAKKAAKKPAKKGPTK
jgi:hypothetical protein